MLGEDLFQKCLKEYINRWQGKHPTPYDFFYTFNDVSGENLNWYWKSWFFEFGYPDLGIKSVTDNKVVIEKVGALPFPIELKVIYSDNSFEVKKYSAKIWKDGNSEFEIESEKVIKSAEILFQNYPDVNEENDVKNK
jgi:aminopeptidase N